MDSSAIDRQLIQLIQLVPPWCGDPNFIARESLDWNTLIARAEKLYLAPLVYVACQNLPPAAHPPTDILARLRRSYLATTAANLSMLHETARLLDLFQREQISVILLKGIALAKVLYADMALRPFSDVDILIHPADQARVAKLMLQQGYSALLDFAAGFRDEYGSEQCYTRSAKIRMSVDAHWHVFNIPYFRRRVPIDWFWQHGEIIQFENRSTQMLDPSAQLIHLAAHFTLHHKSDGLRWSYDLALLIQRWGANISWDETLQFARDFGLNAAVQTVLKQVETVWGVSLPDAARATMQKFQPTLAERFNYALISAPSTEALYPWDASNQNGARAKIDYLWRSLFPNKTYMLERYQFKDARQLPWVYARRLAHGVSLIVRSLGSMATQVWRALVRF